MRLGELVEVPDITKRITIPDEYKNDSRYWFQYRLKDSDTLAHLSRTIYNTPNHWLLIVLMNDMVNIEAAWPIPERDFSNWFQTEFPDKQYGDILHYVDPQGNIQDPQAYVDLGEALNVQDAISKLNLKAVTFYEHYYQINEDKRMIKILLPEFVPGLIKQLEIVLR